MKHLPILLCLLASAAMAENNPHDDIPIAAPEMLPKSSDFLQKTNIPKDLGPPVGTIANNNGEYVYQIAIDRKTCLDLGGQLVNVWENAGSVFYVCMKKDQGMRD